MVGGLAPPEQHEPPVEQVGRLDRWMFLEATAVDRVSGRVPTHLSLGLPQTGRDQDVEDDIRAVVETSHAGGAIVKVIFENAYLTDDEKIRACRLTEAAGGAYTAEALGHKMMVVERHRGRRAAIPVAREYLDRFPDGAYAKSAQAVLAH